MRKMFDWMRDHPRRVSSAVLITVFLVFCNMFVEPFWQVFSAMVVICLFAVIVMGSAIGVVTNEWPWEDL